MSLWSSIRVAFTHYPSLGGMAEHLDCREYTDGGFGWAVDTLLQMTAYNWIQKEKALIFMELSQENRCFFCTQKAVFPINRQDGINSIPCFSRPLTAKKNGDFHPENMSFRHLITQSGAFCFYGSKKWGPIFLEKGLPFHLSQWELVKGRFFQIFFCKHPPKTLSHFKQVKG